MDITINIQDTELSAQDIQLIKESLDIQDIENALSKICKSAFMEYVKMFKEKGIPSRADEVKQERLFFMLNYYYINRVPSENEISTIFQLTATQSRSLLRNTKSKYRTKINSFIKSTLLTTLNSARRNDNGDYDFVCTSQSNIEDLNQIVAQKGPELKSIEKIKGLANKYTCAIDTYNLLIQELS